MSCAWPDPTSTCNLYDTLYLTRFCIFIPFLPLKYVKVLGSPFPIFRIEKKKSQIMKIKYLWAHILIQRVLFPCIYMGLAENGISQSLFRKLISCSPRDFSSWIYYTGTHSYTNIACDNHVWNKVVWKFLKVNLYIGSCINIQPIPKIACRKNRRSQRKECSSEITRYDIPLQFAYRYLTWFSY